MLRVRVIGECRLFTVSQKLNANSAKSDKPARTSLRQHSTCNHTQKRLHGVQCNSAQKCCSKRRMLSVCFTKVECIAHCKKTDTSQNSFQCCPPSTSEATESCNVDCSQQARVIARQQVFLDLDLYAVGTVSQASPLLFVLFTGEWKQLLSLSPGFRASQII